MKLKRILSLLLAGLLLFSFTACRRPQETFASTLPLSDEEFYGEPMLIVRASVINLKKEFLTLGKLLLHALSNVPSSKTT